MQKVYTPDRVHVPRGELLGQFLVITGLSALVVMWAVNTVEPILQSPLATPALGVLLAFVIIGFVLQAKSSK